MAEDRMLNDEILLGLIKANSGGGGGTSNYNQLENKPQINSVELSGNKSLSDLGIASASALANKVDKVEGKGLSTNDYTNEDKAIVGGVTDALAGKQDTLTFDDVPTANSNNPVKSGGVKSAIDAAVASAYHHAGTKTCVELVAGLLVAANEGNVYNMTDSGTTTADFIEGAGQPIKAGDNVGIAKISDGVYKFDLLSGFVDTSNFVQKSVTAGLLKNDGTVNDEIEGDVATLKSGLTNLSEEVNGDATTYPYADVITIEDAVPANLAECNVKIEPVQDLHGYDKPWVGGAGKNMIPMTVSGIKTANTNGTWNGDSYTNNGITWTILTDSDENVIGIKANGTTSDSISLFVLNNNFIVPESVAAYINGSTANVINKVWLSDWSGGAQSIAGEDKAMTTPSDGILRCRLQVDVNKTVSNEIAYPMIRLATETDATFAPYTNLCPISGHTEASVQRDGKNRISVNSYSGSGTWLPSTTIAITGNYLYRQANFTTTGGAYTFSIYGIKNGVETAIDTSANDGDISRYNDVSAYDYVRVVGYSNNASNVLSDVMLCFNDNNTDTIAYEPYQGKTYTIALGDTIYGGTVDFDSGVMTVDRAFAEFDGSNDETWELYNRGSASAFAMYIDIANIMSVLSGTYLKSNYLNKITVNQTWGDYDYWVSAETGHLVTGIKAITTVADWEAYLASNPLQVCYELATPTTIQLTPQQIQLLKGQNTLTASTGQISVTVNGVSGSIGAVQEQVNATDAVLAELAEQLPSAPTTDGAYVLTVTVADGTPTYSWVSGS